MTAFLTAAKLTILILQFRSRRQGFTLVVRWFPELSMMQELCVLSRPGPRRPWAPLLFE